MAIDRVWGFPQGTRHYALTLFVQCALHAQWGHARIKELAEEMAERCDYPISGLESVESIWAYALKTPHHKFFDETILEWLKLSPGKAGCLNLESIGVATLYRRGYRKPTKKDRLAVRRQFRVIGYVLRNGLQSVQKINQALKARKRKTKVSRAQIARYLKGVREEFDYIGWALVVKKRKSGKN